MSEATQTQTPNRPPDWLFNNVINPTMKAILRSPFHGVLSDGLSIVTFIGRKSGKKFSTPVAYHFVDNDDKKLMFTTRSPWWKNFQNGETIQIRIKGKTYDATPEIIHDNDVVWSYVSKWLDEADGNPRRVGVMVGEDATEAEIRAQVDEMIGIKLTLHD